MHENEGIARDRLATSGYLCWHKCGIRSDSQFEDWQAEQCMYDSLKNGIDGIRGRNGQKSAPADGVGISINTQCDAADNKCVVET